MTTTTESIKQGPKCFGQLYDPSVPECAQCDLNVSCAEKTRERGIPASVPAATRSEAMSTTPTGAVPPPEVPAGTVPPPGEKRPKGFQWTPPRQAVKELLAAGWFTAALLITEAQKVAGGGKGTTALDVLTKLKSDGVLETRRVGKVVEYHAKS
jgi:hypothetical protein